MRLEIISAWSDNNIPVYLLQSYETMDKPICTDTPSPGAVLLGPVKSPVCSTVNLPESTVTLKLGFVFARQISPPGS